MSDETKTSRVPRWVRFYPYLLVVAGILGIFASMMLSMDKIKLLENPGYTPNCNLNPILSCTSVMNSSHGVTMTVPNPYLGLAGFAVILTVGMALLAGAQFKKWFWLGLQLGVLGGLAFVHFLYVQSVYGLGKLCMYCMLVWLITIPLFWYTLLMNFRLGHLPVHQRAAKWVRIATKHHADILIAWYLVLTTLIIIRFWYYISA